MGTAQDIPILYRGNRKCDFESKGQEQHRALLWSRHFFVSARKPSGGHLSSAVRKPTCRAAEDERRSGVMAARTQGRGMVGSAWIRSRRPPARVNHERVVP